MRKFMIICGAVVLVGFGLSSTNWVSAQTSAALVGVPIAIAALVLFIRGKRH